MCNGLLQQLIDKGETLNPDQLFAPMIDARRMEVFTGLYDIMRNVVKETHALVVEEDSFNTRLADHTIYFFGSGADKLTQTIVHTNARFYSNFLVSSSHMASLAYKSFLEGKFENLAYFEPYYLKDFITTTPKKKI
jgi:tRNA threonylcarbamoyladenosine biosynthesis protein TsaB